jgi:hypothetical protein
MTKRKYAYKSSFMVQPDTDEIIEKIKREFGYKLFTDAVNHGLREYERISNRQSERDRCFEVNSRTRGLDSHAS